jgi:HEAT repeat protein
VNEFKQLQSTSKKKVLEALCALGDVAEPAEPALEAEIIRLTSSDDPEIRSTAIWVLGCRGNNVDLCVQALRRCLPGRSQDEHIALCQAVAWLCPGFREEFAVFQDFILQCLADANEDVRKWALDAACKLGLEKTHAALCERVRAEVSSDVQRAWDATYGTS